MICVYPADCTDFSTNGNGTLAPLSAEVTETLNGEYELTLVHPIDEAGKWQRLVEGCILRAPVPAATTPRVHFSAPGDASGTEIYRIHTDFSEAETRKGTLNLRSGPGRNYKVLAAYKNTLTVQVIAKTNAAWYEVTAPDGKHGYMDTTYLVYDHTEGSASEAVSSVVDERQLRDQPFRIYRIVPELDKITVYYLNRISIIPREDLIALAGIREVKVAEVNYKQAVSEFNDAQRQVDALEAEALKALTGENQLDLGVVNSMLLKQKARLDAAAKKKEEAKVLLEMEKNNKKANEVQVDEILSWASRFDDASHEAKHLVITQLVDRIEIRKNDGYDITIHWRMTAEQFLGKKTEASA